MGGGLSGYCCADVLPTYIQHTVFSIRRFPEHDFYSPKVAVRVRILLPECERWPAFGIEPGSKYHSKTRPLVKIPILYAPRFRMASGICNYCKISINRLSRYSNVLISIQTSHQHPYPNFCRTGKCGPWILMRCTDSFILIKLLTPTVDWRCAQVS